MQADITGISKTEMSSIIDSIKEYMNGKVYHMKTPTDMNTLAGIEMLEKA